MQNDPDQSFPYSSRARIVLAIARAIASGRGDRDVTPAHVALGLLREGENPAIAVLQHRAVSLPSLRRELEVLLGPRPGGAQPDEVVRPLTRGERHIADQARQWSRRHGDDHVGPEHLLLALVADSDSLVASTLAQHGITPDVVSTALKVVIHKHARSEPPHDGEDSWSDR